MARGFASADGASEEVSEAARDVLHKTRVIVLGQSKNKLVREIVAGRPDCPLGILITLTHDRVPDVRAAVAGNPIASSSILEHLADDKSVEVILALVDNPALSPELLERLAFHRRPEVRAQAAVKLNDSLAVAPVEDSHTPELRDMGVQGPQPSWGPLGEASQEGQQDSVDAREGPGPDASTPAPPRTRTAPVRGFKIP
jgi:hypothetical protein